MAKIIAFIFAILGVLVLTGFVSASITEVRINGLDINDEDAFIAVGSTNTFEVYFIADSYDSDVRVEISLDGQNIDVNAITSPFDVLAGNLYKRTLQIALPYQSLLDYGDVAVVSVEIDGDAYQISEEFNVNVITPGDGDGGGGGSTIDNFCLYNDGSSENPGNLMVRIEEISVVDGFGENNVWMPFDEVEVEVEIDNRGDNDINNIALEWGIYDTELEDWIIDVGGADNFDLNDGDDETLTIAFNIDNNMDIDLEDLDSGDSYILFVRAAGIVDNINHDSTCNWDSNSAEISIPRAFVILKNIIFEPEDAIAGQEVMITADVWNIGMRDQDSVSVRIYNDDLGLDKQILVGDVNSFEKEELNTNILIPADAEEKNYLIELEVLDEDEDIFEDDLGNRAAFVYPLKVERYEPSLIVSASLVSGGFAGERTVIQANVLNTGEIPGDFEISISNHNSFADLVSIEPKTIFLGAGEYKSSLITLQIKEGVSGEQLFTIEIIYNNNTIVFQPIAISIENKDTTPPIITLIDPDDNDNFETSKDDRDINFRFKVSDESRISKCELIIDGDVEATINNPEKDKVISIEENLDSDEGYRWRVECTDEFGNVGVSEEWNFDIEQKEDTGNNDNRVTDLTYPLTDKEAKPKTDFLNQLPEESINLNEQEKSSKSTEFNLNTFLPIILGIAIVVMLVIIGVILRR